MNRREFAGRLSAAAIAASGLSRRDEAAQRPADTAGRVPYKISLMLWTVFGDLPFEQRLEKVAQAGYTNVELVDEDRGWSEADFRKATEARRRLGIRFDAIAAIEHGLTNPAEREAFLAEVRARVAVMEKLECPALIVLSGDAVPGLSREAQEASCVEGLKRAAEIAEKRGVTILLENIDPEENPRYYLTSAAQGFRIIAAVDHPRVKFLYDLYHEQIAEGNLIEKLEKNVAHVGVVHVADVPGRHQPGTGEINYPNIFRKLVELGYEGYVAMEFLPTGDPVRSLSAAREMALDVWNSG